MIRIDFEKLKDPKNASIYRCVLYFNSIFKDFDDIQAWIAGGCFRSFFQRDENINDIDIFTKDRVECAKVVWKLRKMGFKVFFKNKNAIKGFVTVKGKKIYVDVVKKFYENDEDCILDFDFSVCKFAYNLKTKGVVFTENFFADLVSKRLVIPDYNYGNPLGSLKRFQKYVQNGYRACNGTMITMAKRIAETDLSNPENNDIEFYPDGSLKIILFD